MPLVRRIVTWSDESGFMAGSAVHECHVPPGQVRPTDVVIPVEKIDATRLDDLIATHPAEYGHLTPSKQIDADFSDDPEVAAINEAGRIAQLDEEGAIVAVGACENARVLQELLGIEDRPRVLEALGARGFTAD